MSQLPPPIHILGIGNLGKLLAHSLRKQHPTAPITLLFHRRSLADEWEKAERSIGIERNGVSERVGGFGVEFVEDGNGGGIENLIVATKTYKTVDALRGLGRRVDRRSTLLFTQNGIGGIYFLFLFPFSFFAFSSFIVLLSLPCRTKYRNIQYVYSYNFPSFFFLSQIAFFVHCQ